MSFVGSVSLAAVDQYGNPVSNVELVFDAQRPVPETDPLRRGARLVSLSDPCIDVTAGRIPAYGDCGEGRLTVFTSHKGAGAGVILGGSPAAKYSVTVTPAGFAGSAVFNLYTHSMSEDRDYVELSVFSLFDGGNNINACKAGESFPVYAKCYRLAINENDPEDETDDFWEILPFEGKVTMDGYDAKDLGDHIYKDDVPITEPGLWEVKIWAKEGDVIRARAYCEVYGVEFALVDASGQPVTRLYLPADENGIVREDYPIRYRIIPEEYIPGGSYIYVNREGDSVAYLVPEPNETPSVSGIWHGTLYRGKRFDVTAAHTVEAVINDGADEPVRMTTGAIPLEIAQADIDADLYRTGGFEEDDPDETMTGLFVRVNNDDEAASGGQEDDLVEAKLFSRIASGKMALTGTTTGPGRIKVWDTAAKTTLLIDTTDSDPANDTRQWDVTGTLSQSVWIEGMAPSATHADIDLTLTTQTAAGDIVATDLLTVTVCDISIVTDFNRDRKIDEADEQAGARGDLFYFWLNDDNDDDKEVATDSGQDVPGATSTSVLDKTDGRINGTRDLIDFFPVRVTVKPKGILDVSDIEATLMMEQGVVDMACMDIADGSLAGAYLTDVTMARKMAKADVQKFKAMEPEAPKNPLFLEKLRSFGQAFLLAEGVEPVISGTTAESKKALVVRLGRDGNTLLAGRLNLTIDGVEKMFRHKNLRPALGASGGADDRETAPNFPDDPSVNKAFVFIHGFNVSGEAARGWHCEVFKRVFWSGSKARFYGVSWYGDEGTPAEAYYQTDVINAFETGRYFDQFIRQIRNNGEVVVAAHSLGNMMVAAAIQDYDTPVDRYFLVNAALAREVFNPSFVAQDAFMTHKEWRDKGYGERLYASRWHDLFAADDNRSKLTWENIFEKVTQMQHVYNFYSPTDQVLHDFYRDGDEGPFIDRMPSVFDVGDYPWCSQELLKGRWVEASGPFGGSTVMGWEYNGAPSGYWVIWDGFVPRNYTA
ncbi:MAG: alpha/beta fold hydrolase, partial [Thermodesulfobacteriota bacterium]